MKLTVEERGRKSFEVGLKNAQTQAEEQRQKFHYTEIELATAKQQVVDLKAELEKDKEAAQVAQAAADATGQQFYDLGMQEIEAHLTDELVGVCRDYCLEVWIEALNLAGAPATSEWRKVENVYYPEDLREAPEAASGLRTDAAPTTTAPELLPTTQASLPPLETSKGPGKASDQGQGVEVAKGKKAGQGRARLEDKGKGKEAKTLPETKGPEAD